MELYDITGTEKALMRIGPARKWVWPNSSWVWPKQFIGV